MTMRPATRLALTFLAGYCDTATFVKMGGVFSAHVTGNFVLFAAAVARGLEPQDYLKLATMPVFIVAVVVATAIYVTADARKTPADKGMDRGLVRVLGLIALLLASAAGLGVWAPGAAIAVTLMVVFAMGMQNGLHPFSPGAMTTVMTGTVTNTLSEMTRRWLDHTAAEPKRGEVSTLLMILNFVLGCALAAVLVDSLGFGCLFVAAVIAAVLWITESRVAGAR